jgi:hypothetical protein
VTVSVSREVRSTGSARVEVRVGKRRLMEEVRLEFLLSCLWRVAVARTASAKGKERGRECQKTGGKRMRRRERTLL